MKLILVALAAGLLSHACYAQTAVPSFTPADHSATVGTTATVMLHACPSTAVPYTHVVAGSYLFIGLPSNGTQIWYTLDGTTPVANTAGTHMLQNGGVEEDLAGTDNVSCGAVTVIAAAANTPVTVKVYPERP